MIGAAPSTRCCARRARAALGAVRRPEMPPSAVRRRLGSLLKTAALGPPLASAGAARLLHGDRPPICSGRQKENARGASAQRTRAMSPWAPGLSARGMAPLSHFGASPARCGRVAPERRLYNDSGRHVKCEIARSRAEAVLGAFLLVFSRHACGRRSSRVRLRMAPEQIVASVLGSKKSIPETPRAWVWSCNT